MKEEMIELEDLGLGEDDMSPQEALQEMCYTSQREWAGTVYTIEDVRYPEYHGRQVMVSLSNGKNRYEWVV